MGYSIQPHAYQNLFAVPRDVVEKHIKLAGSAQLKALLWMFCHTGEQVEAEDISAAIGLPRADVADAMQYWIAAGIISDTDLLQQNLAASPSVQEPAQEQTEQPSQQEQGQQPQNKPESEQTLPVIAKKRSRVMEPIGKPTREEAIRRGEQSAEISWMLNEAQMRLGRTVSASEMSTLVWLHDSEGLPPAVILMIIEYAVSIGKCNMRYIERIAVNWADEEIDTVEKAEQQLTLLERQRNAWGKVQKIFGLASRSPSAKEQAMVLRWLEEWKFSRDMIRYAYDQCVDQTGKFSMAYINKVLEKCYKNQLKTPQEAEQFMQKNKKTSQRTTSYDISEMEQLLMNE